MYHVLTRNPPQVEEEEEEEEDEDAGFACKKCAKSDHPEYILLCDTCDAGWHTSCIRPAIMVIPEGDWFCPDCMHAELIKRLEEKLGEETKLLETAVCLAC